MKLLQDGEETGDVEENERDKDANVENVIDDEPRFYGDRNIQHNMHKYVPTKFDKSCHYQEINTFESL